MKLTRRRSENGFPLTKERLSRLFGRAAGGPILAALFLALTAVAGMSPLTRAEEANGNSDFTVAFLGDLSGPVGFWNAPRIVGIQDAIEYMNLQLGGIGGRKVRLDWRDHKSNVALAEKAYHELQSRRYLIWHTCGTGEQQMLKLLYEQDKTQVIFTCSTSPGVIYPTGYVFGTAPYYPDQFGAFIDWLVETWDAKAMKRPPRVAFMTYESGYGRACISKETLEYARKKGVKIVDTIYIPFVTTDAVTPLQRARRAGADWVFGQWLWQTVPPYLKANKDLELGLELCVNSFGVDEVMITNAREAAEGLTGLSSWYLTGEDTPGARLIHETIMNRLRRPEDQGSSYFLGWMNMWQTKTVVEETLTRVGHWDKVTPAEIKLTLEGWHDKDINGLGRLNYSSTERGAGILRVVQVRNGKWTPVTGWRKAPDLVPVEWKKASGN